ncbi:pyrroline-5-carboxylate reductase family protein [Xylocopilactobacillus apis]|uniref:Pyrroline-5-carboxylate reductase n=1 Tax=Xylocopilactobacillus apis TaxID=2932183 RepID=A0AAU9D2C1_9LACO|nr:pyrroline-5-carboxylate reductase dimerization domain-containing protein [Xylocopilactobacillus apis]BDR56435.1 pyrroline-5-carboxylate reductase [Xylocopilactobacillus apis]
MFKIGIIGSGNMGQALIQGWLGKDYDLAVFSPRHGIEIANKFQIQSMNLSDLAHWSNILVLAFLPQQLSLISSEIESIVNPDQTIISVLGDVTLKQLKNAFKNNNNIIRTLPNTNIAVNEGEIAYIACETIDEQKLTDAKRLLSDLGLTLLLSEDQFPAFSAVAGSAPAIVAKFAESLVLAAVKNGLSRNDSVKIINQLILGTIKNSKENQISFNDLIYQICTPGGSTIRGIKSLEKNRFTGDVMDSIDEIIQ